MTQPMRFTAWFSTFSRFVSAWTGSSMAFVLAVLTVVVWAALGPFFDWSDSHSLFINTITTVITYGMVFVIQASQNRDTAAIHLKLDELIRVTSAARNELLIAEDLDQKTLDRLRDQLRREAQS